MTIKAAYIVIISLLLVLGLSAQQNPQPYFRNYSTQNGLPSPEVYCAFEDSQGYIWFGTDNGASRFDGYEFKNYGAQEGLLSNVIFDIYEDEKKRIWFGAMTGEAFILDRDSIIPYQYNYLLKRFKEKSDVFGLVHLAKNETAYFEFINYGVLKIDKHGNIDTIKGIFPHDLLIIDVDGCKETIVLRTNKIGSPQHPNYIKKSISVDILTNKKRFQKELPNIISSANSFDAQRAPTGELLISFGQKLYCLKGEQLLWSIPFLNTATEIIFDEDGYIWICLLKSKGVWRYSSLEDVKNNRFELFLNGLSISNVLKDSKGDYWICSQEQGVFFLPDPNILTFDSRIGLSDNFVTSITFKDKNELYIGLFNEEIFKLNLVDNSIIKIGESQKPYHTPSLLYDAKNESLWGGGYYYKDGKLNPFTYWDSTLNKTSTFLDESFDNLHFNKRGYLIGDTPYAGFAILDIHQKKIIYSVWSDTLQGRIYGLYSDFSDRLWVGKADGLFEFKDSMFVHPKIEHPAFHHRVEDIYQMPDSSLVFGTKGFGVIIWKENQILSITQGQGLTSNMIEDVHVDELGTLWVGTLNGLNKITLNNDGIPNVRQFTVSNGLPTNEIYDIKSYEGQLWLCTNKGLVQFQEPSKNTIATKPIIQWIKVNQRSIDLDNNHLFNYDENNFELSYLSFNYRLDGKIKYRYRTHKKSTWQYTQNRNVNFPSLSSGKYHFEVQAQNEDQYWSESSLYIFTISPPWWTSWWFRSLSVLAVGMGGYLFYKNRVNKIKKENELSHQMIELEKAALQAQMSPHFIFNSLNSIQNFILKNDKKKAVEYLSRFAKLVRHNLDASMKGTISIDEEVRMLDNYLALEQERFNNRFEYKISVSNDLTDDFPKLPIMMVQPFVENAVIHGMANKKEGGMITVDFSKNTNYLQIHIKDNGIGFEQSKKERKSNLHKSAGASITKKRLKLLDTKSSNTIKMEEIKNDNNETIGTMVTVLIKI